MSRISKGKLGPILQTRKNLMKSQGIVMDISLITQIDFENDGA